MLIGLTGQIGAGKSAVADILESRGALVIDADQIGRRVVEDSFSLRRRLVSEFGTDILTDIGELDRKKLAKLAFASPGARAKLNSLVHPYLLRELGKQVKSALRFSKLVVIDAALLLEWGLDDDVDQVWVVHASQDNRLSRLEARGISREDALARQKLQLSSSEFRRRADVIIENDDSIDDLRKQVDRELARIGEQSD